MSPLSSAEFKLDAPIEPIRLTPPIWKLLQLSDDVLPASIARVSIDGPTHGHLSQLVCAFMQNRKHGTKSEDGLHGRDNHLLDIICLLSGLDPQRNTVSFSTKHLLRTDVYLALPGSPPLVHVEEKAQAGELVTARKELSDKFCALPHYDRSLRFIIGIAIAGDWVSFGKLPLLGGGFEPFGRPFDLADLEQRLLCVQAAVNVGRWARRAVDGDMVSPVAFPIGVKDSNQLREITLMSEGFVSKKYLNMDKDQRTWLHTLYTTIASGSQHGGSQVRYMEWATSCSKGGDEAPLTLSLDMRPFGVVASSRPPRSLAELQSALRCVLTCLLDLHQHRWVHLDLRWSNIVYLSPQEWFVIDAEWARPFKVPMPAELKNKDKEAKEADAQADLYLVGVMMQEHMGLVEQDLDAGRLLALLTGTGRDRVKRTASGALESQFIKKNIDLQ